MISYLWILHKSHLVPVPVLQLVLYHLVLDFMFMTTSCRLKPYFKLHYLALQFLDF